MTLLTELQRRNVIRVGVPSSEFISAELSHAARKGEEAAVLVAVARRRIRSADVVEGRVWRALSSEETSNTKVDVDVNGRRGSATDGGMAGEPGRRDRATVRAA